MGAFPNAAASGRRMAHAPSAAGLRAGASQNPPIVQMRGGGVPPPPLAPFHAVPSAAAQPKPVIAGAKPPLVQMKAAVVPPPPLAPFRAVPSAAAAQPKPVIAGARPPTVRMKAMAVAPPPLAPLRGAPAASWVQPKSAAAGQIPLAAQLRPGAVPPPPLAPFRGSARMPTAQAKLPSPVPRHASALSPPGGAVIQPAHLIESRGGTNPSAYARKRLEIGDVDYDSDVRDDADDYMNRGGKNVKGDIVIDASHRTSDRGIRHVFEDVMEEALDPTSTLTAQELKDHVEEFVDVTWDEKHQTKAQKKKVDEMVEVLNDVIDTKSAPSKSKTKKLNTGIKVVSKDSVKNLYPGGSKHNRSRGKKPDFRTKTSKVGKTRKRALSPTSDSQARFLDKHKKKSFQRPSSPSIEFAYDPTDVPMTYTNSANTEGK